MSSDLINRYQSLYADQIGLDGLVALVELDDPLSMLPYVPFVGLDEEVCFEPEPLGAICGYRKIDRTEKLDLCIETC